MDFKGKIFRVATNPSVPRVFIEYEAKNDRWIFTGGYEVQLFKVLSKILNFTYEVENCKNVWGTQLPNKTWTGIIGSVASEFSDIGFSAVSVTYDRSKVVYYLNPHLISTLSFITSIPKAEQSLTLSIKPFEYSVWIYFIMSFIIILFQEWILSQFYIELNKIAINWAIICASLRQPISCNLPSVWPLKMMLCTWLLGCLVLTSGYSGCLHSLMAIPSKLKTINTVEELAIAQQNGEIQVLSAETAYYHQSFKSAQLGVYKELGEFIKPVSNKKIAYDTVKNSPKAHAYISSEDSLAYHRIELGRKSFYLPPSNDESTLNLDVRAIVVHKHFKYIKIFNKIISNIVSGGLVNFWVYCEKRKITKFYNEDSTSSSETDQQNDKIDLKKLQSFSIMFIIGILVSSLIFIIELIFNRFVSKP